jgi:hypothetical protein
MLLLRQLEMEPEARLVCDDGGVIVLLRMSMGMGRCDDSVRTVATRPVMRMRRYYVFDVQKKERARCG